MFKPVFLMSATVQQPAENGFFKVLSDIGSGIKTVFNKILEFTGLKALGEKIASVFDNSRNDIKQGKYAGLDAPPSLLQQGGQFIGNTVQNVAKHTGLDKAWEQGKDLVNGFTQGVQNALTGTKQPDSRSAVTFNLPTQQEPEQSGHHQPKLK